MCVCGNLGKGLQALTPQEVGTLLTAQHPACLVMGTSPQVVGGGRLAVVWVFHNDSFLKVTLTPGWVLLGTGQWGKHRKRKVLPVRKQRAGR